MSQLMPLPLTVSCFSKIQVGFTFLVPAHLGSPGKRAVERVCVCMVGMCVVCVCLKTFRDDSALSKPARLLPTVGQLPMPVWSAFLTVYRVHYYVSGVHSCDVIDNSALQTGTGKLRVGDSPAG